MQLRNKILEKKFSIPNFTRLICSIRFKYLRSSVLKHFELQVLLILSGIYSILIFFILITLSLPTNTVDISI